MINGKLRVLGLAIVTLIGVLMSVKAGSAMRTAFDVAGCVLFASGLLALTGPRRLPSWADAAILLASIFLLLGLMLVDDRPMLPGILFFVLIPATTRMQPALRGTAYLGAVAALACVYIARRLYPSVDPIVPICQFACLACLAAFAEIARHERESLEENTRLLEGLIAAQRRIADAESRGHGDDGAAAAVRKSIGGLLAKAALQVEGAKELWSVDRNRAAQLSYKAEETIRTAMDRLRDPAPADACAPTILPARILIAHAGADMAESVALVVGADSDLVVVGTVDGVDGLERSCEGAACGLALIDEDLPGGGWRPAVAAVLRVRPGTPCLVMSVLPSPGLDAGARGAGAAGVLDCGSSPADMLAAIHRAAVGVRRPRTPAGHVEQAGMPPRPEFTARELQILALIAKGFSNKEISDRLFLAEGTVKNRVTSILQKIGARDRGNAALKGRELGLI